MEGDKDIKYMGLGAEAQPAGRAQRRVVGRRLCGAMPVPGGDRVQGAVPQPLQTPYPDLLP